MAEVSLAPDTDIFEGGFSLPEDLSEKVLASMGEVPNYQDMVIPVNQEYLASWQAANQVTDANNSTPLSNAQLQQIKTFAALQPKYVPIVPGEGDRYNKRMEQAKQTPGAIYSNFETYADAMQEHNAQVKQYIEQENIPTSVEIDGKTLYLNVGTTPAYYQEQADGGELKNIWHPGQRSGEGNTFYSQTGEVGTYGTFARDAYGTEKNPPLKDAAPFIAAALIATTAVMAVKATAAATGAQTTGMVTYTPSAAVSQTGGSSVISSLTNAIKTGKNAAERVLSEFLASVTGASPTTNAGANIVQIPSLGQIAKGGTVASGVGAVVEGLSTTGDLPGGITYSGPGAGPDGALNPGVIYNITATAAAQEEEDTSEQDAIDITAAVATAVDAITVPEDNPDVIAANDAVTAAQTAAQTSSDNVATVIDETNASVASAENMADYMGRRYGYYSSQYRSAKKRADAAKLDAQNKVNQARTEASVAQADYENAVKLQQGTYKDAQDAYKVAQVKARRDAEADVQQRIAERKEQDRIQRTTDTDGDGVYDVVDLFPNDPTEWADSDGDGVGNNAQQKALDEALLTTVPDYPEFDDLPVVVPVEPIEPPEDPPLDIPEPIIEPIEDPTTGSSGDEGTPTEPVEPVDDAEQQATSTDIIAAQLREAIDTEEDPDVKQGLQLELDKWLSGGPTEYQTLPSGPPPPDVTEDFEVTDAVSWVARLTDYFKQSPGSGITDIDPTDSFQGDFPEVPPTSGPVDFDPVEPVEEPIEDPVKDPTGGAADTGTGVGDTGTGGGEGGGDGTGTGTGAGTGAGVGLAVGLAAGMLKPQAVTKTLFEDFEFQKNYQAPEIIPGLSDLPTYKAPPVGLFQGII